MRSRDPFGEVLEGLRLQIRRGEIAPGAPLIVLDLAAALGVSATPVREALAYLAGEGLVEGRQGPLRGYLARRPGPGELTDLLRLHQAQVAMALAASVPGGHAGPSAENDGAGAAADLDRVARTEVLFAAIVARGGGVVLQRAHRLVADRLHLVRRREGQVLSGLDAEFADLARAAGEPSAAVAIRAYHRRRIAAAARLAGLLGNCSQGA